MTIYIYDFQDSALSHYSTVTIQNVSLGTCFFIAENVNYTLLYHIYYIYACSQACHLQATWSLSSQSGEIENQLPHHTYLFVETVGKEALTMAYAHCVQLMFSAKAKPISKFRARLIVFIEVGIFQDQDKDSKRRELS